MIPQRASLAVLPRIIRLYRLLAYVLVGIGIVVSLLNIFSWFSAGGIVGLNQMPALAAVIFGPIVAWGLAGLGMYTFALVLELLASIERSTRATANYLEWQMGEKERGK